MPRTKSPLRYPGGKTQLAKFVEHTIHLNNISHPIYCEPFCGGSGVAIELLLNNSVDFIILNDYDSAIYSFWYALLNETAKFLDMVLATPIDITTWHIQKEIYVNLKNTNGYNFDLGFATFFLNRTNRAGIITGGPIGGINQSSKYPIDCRFKKDKLIQKMTVIANERDKITLFNMDASALTTEVLMHQAPESLFIFFDPPYYKQGKKLYTNAFIDQDHVDLSNVIREMNDFHWIATYDNENRIKEIYHDMDIREYTLQYSANQIRREQELFFHSPHTIVEEYDKVSFTR